MYDLPACTRCAYDLRDDEHGRLLCGRCEDRTAHQLGDIAGPRGLYARLDGLLQRGSGSGGPAVSGSKTAPAPLRIDVLSLQCAGGPVLGPLETWVRDWEGQGHADMCEAGGLQQRVDHACRTLRFNLSWAAGNHEAVDEFAAEIGSIHRTLTGITAGEKPARKLAVVCPCGQRVPFTLATRGETCAGCGTSYGHGDITRMPLAGRAAA